MTTCRHCGASLYWDQHRQRYLDLDGTLPHACPAMIPETGRLLECTCGIAVVVFQDGRKVDSDGTVHQCVRRAQLAKQKLRQSKKAFYKD